MASLTNCSDFVTHVILVSDIIKIHTSTKKSEIESSSDNLSSNSQDSSYLKSFDTAVIAYSMMGLGNF